MASRSSLAPDGLANSIGRRIYTKRMLAAMTQAQLADRVGMAKEHLSRLENGHYMPSVRLLLDLTTVLSKATNISIHELVTGKPHA